MIDLLPLIRHNLNMKNFFERIIKSETLSHFASEILSDQYDQAIEKQKLSNASFFESTDLAIVNGLSLGLPDNYLDKVAVIFSRLSILFFTGILLEKINGAWIPQVFFHKGHLRDVENQVKKKIILPQVSPTEILKTSITPIFSKLEIDFLIYGDENNCFLMQPTPDFSFIVTSRLGDPWLKSHLEKVQENLMRAFAG